MSLQAGQTLIGDADTVSYEAGETISPGDAVGIDSGTLRRADSGDTGTNAIGIAGRSAGEGAGDDYASGEDVPAHLQGVAVLTNVASAVSAGDELGPSATAGQLETGSDGFEAITDAGAAAGLATNETVPSGLAAVKLP